MKNITEYLGKKNVYQEIYGNTYAKSLKKDIRNIKLSKKLVFLVPICAIVLYWGTLLLLRANIDIGHFWMSVGMVGMQIPGMLNLERDIDKLKKSSNLNLVDLLNMLLRNDIETDIDKLKDGILTREIEKEKVEYREVDTNKKIINHEIKTVSTSLYFKDVEDKIRCLKEIRQIITFQGEKEEEKTLQIMDMDEINEEQINPKLQKKLLRFEKKF